MIISNSSPLILLAKINKLELLKKMYQEICIPPEVYREVVQRGKDEWYSDAYLVERQINETISIKQLTQRGKEVATKLKGELGSGESEAIALTIQEEAALLLMDNLEPRKVAEEKGIKCRSTPGILLEALKKKVIAYEEYIESIKKLASYAWLSGDIVAYFLEQGFKMKEEKRK